MLVKVQKRNELSPARDHYRSLSHQRPYDDDLDTLARLGKFIHIDNCYTLLRLLGPPHRRLEGAPAVWKNEF